MKRDNGYLLGEMAIRGEATVVLCSVDEHTPPKRHPNSDDDFKKDTLLTVQVFLLGEHKTRCAFWWEVGEGGGGRGGIICLFVKPQTDGHYFTGKKRRKFVNLILLIIVVLIGAFIATFPNRLEAPQG